MVKHVLSVFLILLALACSDAPATAARTEPKGGVPVDSVVQDSVELDQIAYTRELNPDAAKENLPPVTPAPAPAPAAVAPPPPTNVQPAVLSPEASPAATKLQGPDHRAWTDLLSRHVSAAGAVDYDGMRKDMDELDAYLETLAREVPNKNWATSESLAYWINAYNAFTVKLILDNWPVRSIREIDEPWDTKFITLAGDRYSLNQIENDIIRAGYEEPRIHFALVCAAVSCPPLAREAYTADGLDGQLERRTRQFINDETYNVTQEEVVRVSSLFDWYQADFGDVLAFLNTYLPTDIPSGKQLYYLDYDWALND